GGDDLVALARQQRADNPQVRGLVVDDKDSAERGFGVRHGIPVAGPLPTCIKLNGRPPEESQVCRRGPMSVDVFTERVQEAPPAALRGSITRQAPGARPSRATAPMPTRTSRKVGSPTAAVIRRTCRLRPSVMTTCSQASGTVLRKRTGGSRGHR